MKKIFALAALIFAFTLNTQDATAQQKPEDIAKTKIANISEQLELTSEQQRTLFRVFVKKEAAYARESVNAADKKEADATFESELKNALTDEQYKKYQSIKN